MNKSFSKKEFVNEFLINPDTNSYNIGDEIGTDDNSQIKSNNTTDFNAMQIGGNTDLYNRFGYFFEELISKKNVSEFIFQSIEILD